MADVTEHGFQVGQLVTIRRSPLSSAAGQYVILRLMPSEGQAVRYRIKGSLTQLVLPSVPVETLHAAAPAGL